MGLVSIHGPNRDHRPTLVARVATHTGLTGEYRKVKLLPQHWIMLLIVIFAGYVLGERFPNALKGIPLVGQFT